MTATAIALAVAWTTEEIKVAGSSVRLRSAGRGAPLLVLHHDIGTPERLPFYEPLAERFTCCCRRIRATTSPSGRPGCAACATSPSCTSALLADARAVEQAALVGLGFGGWIAAEMATHGAARLRAAGAGRRDGHQAAEGEILDQALVSYIDYARAGFHDQAAFERGLRRRALDATSWRHGTSTAR